MGRKTGVDSRAGSGLAQGDRTNQTMTDHSHSVELEVTGRQIPLLRDLLNRVELSSSISRVRVEIESDKPFLKDGAQDAVIADADETVEDADEATDDEQAVESTARSNKSDPTAELLTADGGETATASTDTRIETASPEDASLDTAHLGDNTGRAATDYLESDLPNRMSSDGVLDPDEFRDIITSPIQPDTNKWRVLGLLYRTQGSLTLGQTTAMLEDTAWEMPYSSVSSTLTKAKANGYVYKEKRGVYQLTQLGRDYMESLVCHTTGYGLQTADKASEKGIPR